MLSDYGILILIANENTAKCTIKYFMNIFWSNNFGFYYIKLYWKDIFQNVQIQSIVEKRKIVDS